MDVDQILRIKAYPKGKKEHEKEIILGRGNKDSKCMETISKCIQDVYSSDEMSENQKIKFTESIQIVVDEINKLGNISSDNQKWSEIGYKVLKAKEAANSKEEENDEMYFIFSQILLSSFAQYLDNTDTIALRRLVSRFEGTTNVLERQQLLDEMKEITENYIILIQVFTLKLAADQVADPNSARQLINYFNSAMLALQNNDISEVILILNSASPLLTIQRINFGTGMTST